MYRDTVATSYNGHLSFYEILTDKVPMVELMLHNILKPYYLQHFSFTVTLSSLTSTG